MTINQVALCNEIASTYGFTKSKYKETVLDFNTLDKTDDVKYKLLMYPVDKQSNDFIALVHTELWLKSNLEILTDIKKFKKTELYDAIVIAKHPVVFKFGNKLMVAYTKNSWMAPNPKAHICLIDENANEINFAFLKEFLLTEYPLQTE